MIKRYSPFILVLFLSGCGLTLVQKQQVTQFASATETVSQKTIDQFKTTRDKVVELKRRILIMENEIPPKSLDLDGGLNVSGLATRITSVKALGEYGALLNALASDSQTEAITKAMSGFLTQLETVGKTQNPAYTLDDDKKSSFAGIIAMAASWSLEKEKKKQIKIIINTYTPEITKLATLLKNDLVLKESSKCIKKENRPASRIIKTGVIDHYCTTLNEALLVSKFKLQNKRLRFQERSFAYDSYVLGLSALKEVRLMSAKGKKSIGSLIKANKSLSTVVNDDKVEKQDIKAFAQQITELKDLVHILASN